MPKTAPIQDNFSAGEVSPRFIAQANSPAYKNGVAYLENFIPLAQGPVSRRFGAEYIGALPGTYGRTFGFPVSANYPAMVIVTDQGELTVETPDGVITEGNLVANGNFLQAGDSWTDISENSGYVIFSVGNCQLVPGLTHPTIVRDAGIRQAVTIATPGNTHNYAVASLESATLCDMRVTIGTTPGGNDLVDVTVQDSSPHLNGSFIPGVATVYIDVWGLENAVGYDRFITNVSIVDPLDDTPVSFSTPWSAEDLPLIQVGMPPGSNTMYFYQPKHPPQYLDFDIDTDTWTFGPIVFTGAPAEWTTGNYPGCVTFFQGRQWVGGTPNQPESFWGSMSGSYLNFTVGANPADAMAFVMSNKGAIRWMVGAKNLLIGSEYGEYIVISTGDIVVPGDIGVDQQSAYGSAPIQPVQIGNRVVYISPDRRKVRDMGYKWTEDGWVSRDITFASEHLTEDNPIVDIIFAQNPHNLLICVTQSGIGLGATFDIANDIVGWFRINSQGTIVALCTVNSNGKSIVGALINRDVETTATLYFEVFAQLDYLDSHEHFSDFTGLDISVPHLKNKTVAVIIDGAIHPDIILDANGDGVLQWTGSYVVVGLSYNSIFRTLPLTTTLQIGQSTMPMMKRDNKIYLRLYDSAIPIVNDYRPPTRYPSTPMGVRQPNVTEDVKVVNLGWDKYAIITVTQDLALACNVAGIFGEAAQELIGRT